MHNNECLSTEPSVHILPNGLQVVIQEDSRFPLVAMRLYIHAGSAFEGPEEAGVSHLLEHMAFKGGEGQAAGQAAREAERVGGSINAATGFDHTMYMIDLPASEWSLGLELLYDLCFRIQADEDELEMEKAVVLAELERNQDDPKRRLFELLQGCVWQGTSYERPVIGRRESLEAMSLDRLRDYRERLYQPQAMVLVVCGDVATEDIMDRAASLFGACSNTRPWDKAPKLENSCFAGQEPRISVERTSWSKVYFAAGFPVPALASPWATALEALTYLLCGDRTSRWYRKFQYELELVDDIAVSPVLLERGGLIYLRAQLDADKLPDFWRSLLQELGRIDSEVFSSEEIARAKLNIEDGLLQTRETLSGVAAKLGFFQFFEGDLQAESRYLHQLKHLSGQELSEALKQFVNPEGMEVCLLVPDAAGIEADRLQEDFDLACPAEKGGRTREPKRQPSGEKETVALENGCRLVLIPDRTLPYAAIDLSWPGGDLLLDKSEQGLPSLTARALMRGTEQRSHHEIQEHLAERAASMEAFASRDQFSITAKFPTKFSQDILDVLQEVVSRPAFQTEEVDKARQDQVAVIVERSEHPLGLISREVFPFLFPGQSYGFYHLGRPEALQDFESSALQSFWSRQAAQPWVMSVCGSFDPDQMRQTAELLSSLSPGPSSIQSQEVTWSNEKELKLVLADRRQMHILLVFPLPGLADASSPGIALLKNLLAGQGGLLFREMRDKQGLGYAVTPMLWRTKAVGFLAFYIGTEPEKSQTALQSFHDLVEQLRSNAIDPEEIARAQKLLRTEYYRERQSLASRSSEASDLLTYGFELDFHKKTIDTAMTLTAEDVSWLARQYLDLEAAYTITLSTTEDMER